MHLWVVGTAGLLVAMGVVVSLVGGPLDDYTVRAADDLLSMRYLLAQGVIPR